MLSKDLNKTLPNLGLPGYFLHGIYDFTCAYTESKAYFDTLTAPTKGFYTIFGAKRRPRQTRHRDEPRLAIVVETLEYGLSVYKVHFANLTHSRRTRKASASSASKPWCTTPAIFGCGRMIERFPDIVGRLEAMLERFMAALDCVDAAFISDATLDQLPLPSQVGKTTRGRCRHQPTAHAHRAGSRLGAGRLTNGLHHG
jgi:hypothetical protein